jgi:hypothetical protein
LVTNTSTQILASDEQSLKLQSGGIEVYEFTNGGLNPTNPEYNIDVFAGNENITTK